MKSAAALALLLAGATGGFFLANRLGSLEASALREELASERLQAALQAKAVYSALASLRERDAALVQKAGEEHHNLTREIDHARARNRYLARQLGGLRDPGARDCPVPPSAGAEPPAGAPPSAHLPEGSGAVLSEEATDFILELANRADKAAAYAWLCHQWAKGLKEGRPDEH